MATYTFSCYAQNLNGNGGTDLASITQEIEGDTIAVTDTTAYKTYAGTYLFKSYRFGQSPSRLIDQPINLTAATDGTIYFSFVKKGYISEFSWTDDDANKIKKGAPSSNLLASAFNDAYQKMVSMKGLTRTGYYASDAATSGGTVKASSMKYALTNGIADAFMYMEGVKSATSEAFYAATSRKIAAGKPITAEILATGEYSIKNMLNRIILAVRP